MIHEDYFPNVFARFQGNVSCYRIPFNRIIRCIMQQQFIVLHNAYFLTVILLQKKQRINMRTSFFYFILIRFRPFHTEQDTVKMFTCKDRRDIYFTFTNNNVRQWTFSFILCEIVTKNIFLFFTLLTFRSI